MTNKRGSKNSFAFRLSKEKIKEFSKLSAEDKLNWLEDANRLVAELLPEEKLKRWEKFIAKK